MFEPVIESRLREKQRKREGVREKWYGLQPETCNVERKEENHEHTCTGLNFMLRERKKEKEKEREESQVTIEMKVS